MAMPLRCYANSKNNNNSNVSVALDYYYYAFRLMRQRQKRRKLECAALFCAAVSAGFKTQRGAYTSSILSFSAWLAVRNNTSLFLQRRSLCFLQKRLMFLHFTWHENVKKLGYIRSDRSDWNGIISKYDQISIEFAQKSDLGWTTVWTRL